MSKRSSKKLNPGPDVVVEVSREALRVASEPTFAGDAISFFVNALGTAAIKYAVSWLRQKTAINRDLRDIARRIADASVDPGDAIQLYQSKSNTQP